MLPYSSLDYAYLFGKYNNLIVRLKTFGYKIPPNKKILIRIISFFLYQATTQSIMVLHIHVISIGIESIEKVESVFENDL